MILEIAILINSLDFCIELLLAALHVGTYAVECGRTLCQDNSFERTEYTTELIATPGHVLHSETPVGNVNLSKSLSAKLRYICHHSNNLERLLRY